VAREAVIDVLALAFSRSMVRDAVTRDALVACLEPWEQVFRNNRVLALDKVWELAKGSATFDEKSALAPLCFVKTQERRMGIVVELPRALNLSATDIQTHAALCPVKREDLDKILGPSRPTMMGEPRTDNKVTRDLTMPVIAAAARRRAGARWKTIAASVLLAAGVGLSGVTLISTCGGGRGGWRQLDTAAFDGIPVKDAKKLGNQVTATLSDPAWLKRPEAERRALLLAALERLRSQHAVEVVALLGEDRQVRAAAQLTGSPPRPQVRWYR
jgi:hypothetical protein